MISQYLQTIVRCPVCLADAANAANAEGLEPKGQDERAGQAQLLADNDRYQCSLCKRAYPAPGGGFLDLRPPAGTFQDLTEYADQAFQHRAGLPIRPLFLSAKIKLDMMRKMLRPSSDERLLDIGCGNGRFLYYQRTQSLAAVGIDAGSHFASEPLASVDLTRGDVRQLPFAAETFDKAFSLDVLEHLDEEGVRQMLSEARRVIKTGGSLFLYSHVMMSSRLAIFQRGVNRLVRVLDRIGWLDNEPERHRKSDHRNAMRSYEQLEGLLAEVGFEIADIRYYNVFFKAVIEDLMVPLVEQQFFKKKAGSNGHNASAPKSKESQAVGAPGHDHADHDHHESLRPEVGRWAHGPLTVATMLMKLDVLLFGRVRTGPFFLLLKAV